MNLSSMTIQITSSQEKQMVLQPHEVETIKFTTITDEKNLKDDLANFTIVMSLIIHNFLYSF